MKNIFITGISGFLGANVCEDLLEQGYKVKGLVRNIAKYTGRFHKNLELIEGTLFDDLTKIIKDVDVVIHIAAVTDQNLLKYSDYYNVNCNATIQLFNVAVKNKVSRFIFISSANTLGYGTLQQPGSEITEIKPLFKASFYAKSKLEAENYILENKHKIETVIVNPTFMLGAYDTKPSSGKIILMGWKKNVVFYPPGGKNFVHVKDVSHGIIKAITKGKPGNRYLLANENLSYKAFFSKLNSVTRQRPVMIKIPKPVLIGLGHLGSLLRFLNIKTSLSVTNTKILCIENYFSNTKSVANLGIDYRPVEKAIADAVNYFNNSKSKSYE